MPRSLRVLLLVGAIAFVGATVADLVTGDVLGAVLHAVMAVVVGCGPVASFLRPLPPDDPAPTGAPQDVTAGPVAPWIALGALFVGIGAVSGVRSPTASVLPLYLVAIGTIVGVQAVRRRDDAVRFDDDALVVVTRAGEEAYAWADVLEVSWSPLDFPRTGSGPVLRVRGGSFDVPGPTAPLQVAAVPLWGRHRRAAAREQVRRAAARHGIPYTEGLVQLIGSGKRLARLPGERS